VDGYPTAGEAATPILESNPRAIPPLAVRHLTDCNITANYKVEAMHLV
jgi:hypothetical protein